MRGGLIEGGSEFFEALAGLEPSDALDNLGDGWKGHHGGPCHLVPWRPKNADKNNTLVHPVALIQIPLPPHPKHEHGFIKARASSIEHRQHGKQFWTHCVDFTLLNIISTELYRIEQIPSIKNIKIVGDAYYFDKFLAIQFQGNRGHPIYDWTILGASGGQKFSLCYFMWVTKMIYYNNSTYWTGYRGL